MPNTSPVPTDDPRFENRLRALALAAPTQLHVRGDLPSLACAVAIVGTRAADDDGLAFTSRLAGELAQAGVVVVSGGARGIDSAAHRGALSVGGRTVAVLASGLDAPYPPENAPLFEAIVQGRGALVSELPDGVAPHPGQFLRRNRLVAAAVQAVVVVQAPARSGALATARWAQRLGKTLFCVPHAPWDPRGEGCLALLVQGARVCAGARDVLKVAAPGALLPGLLLDPPCLPDLPSAERAVLAALGRTAAHVDDLAVRSGVPIARLQHALCVLMLAGAAVDRGGGRWSRT